MDHVKFVEENCADHTPSNFLKGCPAQILLSLFLNTLSCNMKEPEKVRLQFEIAEQFKEQ